MAGRAGRLMTASPVSDLVLAADISASGDFIAMGRMHAPCPALAAAARDLQDNPADPDPPEIQVYSLASNAAGLCILDSGDIEKVLQACFAAQLVAEWRIEIPGAGFLQAPFAVARFEPVKDAARTFALGLRLAGKPEFIGLKDRAA
jgi:hypothetical protein